MSTTSFYNSSNPEPEPEDRQTDPVGFLLMVPMDLTQEDDDAPTILLRKSDNSLIKYPLGRFLRYVSEQMGVPPWFLMRELVSDEVGMTFQKYCLPFSYGETIWLTAEELNKPSTANGAHKTCLHDMMIYFEEFVALNPYASNKAASMFRRTENTFLYGGEDEQES